MLDWRFCFKNEIPINCLFTQWKWTFILDFGSWRRSALNVSYMNKRPSRMQGQYYFLKSGGVDNTFRLRYDNFRFVLWELPGGAGLWTLTPIHLHLKVCRGRFNIHPCSTTSVCIPNTLPNYYLHGQVLCAHHCAEYYSAYSEFHKIPIVASSMQFCFLFF